MEGSGTASEDYLKNFMVSDGIKDPRTIFAVQSSSSQN